MIISTKKGTPKEELEKIVDRFEKQGLDVTLITGKEGVTEAVERELDALLESHELVKGKVLESAMLTPRTVSEALCEATGADAVQCIGSKFVVYRQSSDEDKRRIVLVK